MNTRPSLDPVINIFRSTVVGVQDARGETLDYSYEGTREEAKMVSVQIAYKLQNR